MMRIASFAFLQATDNSARRPVSYASQRFTSISYEQWVKIEKSFNAYWQAFELLYPNRQRRSKEEEYQYMIADFIADLLAFLDTMKPIVDLMLHVQSLDTPIWRLKLWWPKVKYVMEKTGQGDPDSFPKLKKARDSIKPGGEYKGVTLLPGWLIKKIDRKGKVYSWSMREGDDIE
eukprot:gene9841-18419_t